jgi:hypothetical protein
MTQKEKLGKLVSYFERPSVIKKIDSEAEKRHLNRSNFCRIAVRRALEESKQ